MERPANRHVAIVAIVWPALAAACLAPGRCEPWPAKFSNVLEFKPRVQWNTGGGYCGEISIQSGALLKGAWLSEDIVRRASLHGQGHGDAQGGFEVLPTNVADTVKNLGLQFDEWNYNSSRPQAAGFKRWIKAHLAKGHPVVWFPIQKGESHDPYAGRVDVQGHVDAPNGGAYDHVEPMWGIGSNHPLTDTEVYDDDWIVHGSNHDSSSYYRKLNSLEDDLSMQGNCQGAGARFGQRSAYPCFYKEVTYAVAIEGLNIAGSLPVSLKVSGPNTEPDVSQYDPSRMLLGSLSVSQLHKGRHYALYRFHGVQAYLAERFQKKVPFVAAGETWSYNDPDPFRSDSAVYYVVLQDSESAGSRPASFLQRSA